MNITWQRAEAPGFAKIGDGQLLRLSTELPAFDDKTQGLQSLSLADRIAAGWYQVTCEAPGFTR